MWFRLAILILLVFAYFSIKFLKKRMSLKNLKASMLILSVEELFL